VPWGLGRIGDLHQARSASAIALQMAEWSASEAVSITGEAERMVSRLAVVPGPADKVVAKAAAGGAQALVAGEAGWHATVEAGEYGLTLITIGHLESERALIGAFTGALEAAREKEGWRMEIEGYKDREGRWG